MGIFVRTDKQWWDFIHGYEILPWYEEFDYLSMTQFENALFVKYRGTPYALDDFMPVNQAKGIPRLLMGWDGYLTNKHDTGIVIKLSKNREKYKIGYFYTTGGS